MTDKELIKQEIERRIDLYSIAEKDDLTFARMGELSGLIDFIDSLSEEHNEDLEEEIDEEIDNLCELGCYMEDLAKGNSEGIYPLPDNVVKELRKFARHFAEWQKQKMMKDAVEYRAEENGLCPTTNTDLKFIPKVGDRVKLIIIKEN